MSLPALIYCFVQIVLLTSCGRAVDQTEGQHLKPVGHISYDASLDAPDFIVCNDDWVLEYYNFSNAIQYHNEKPAIADHINKHFRRDPKLRENGYVTVRFIVNCNGETGRFRVLEMDRRYEKKRFSPELVKQIVAATKSLKGWRVAQKDGVSYDYHQYLTYKIVDGTIKEILP